MSNRISESSLTDVFEHLVRDGVAGLPLTLKVVRELETPFGVVDVAALETSAPYARDAGALLRRREVATTMSLLKEESHRTVGFISSRIGLSIPQATSVLEEMGEAKLASERSGGFVTGPMFAPSSPTLWALELKVEHWGRALHQALRYRVFANRVAVVMPLPWARNAIPHRDRFRASGVGLLGVDVGKRRVLWLVRPRLRKPASAKSYWDSVGRLLARVNDESADLRADGYH